MRCSCAFTSNNIIDDTFSCRGSQGEFRNTVVYRAMINLQVPASVTDADDIVNDINQWVQTMTSVGVNGVTLDIDSDCPTMLDSLTSDDCVIGVSPDQTNSPSSSSSSPFAIIIGVSVAVVIIILLIIVVVTVVYRRHKSTYR